MNVNRSSDAHHDCMYELYGERLTQSPRAWTRRSHVLCVKFTRSLAVVMSKSIVVVIATRNAWSILLEVALHVLVVGPSQL